MSHTLAINANTNREEMYRILLPQLHALVEGETDSLANLSNLVAALHHAFNFLWTGIYFVRGQELVLGPFQGPVACTRIGYGKGVCGSSWKEKKTILVPDVHAFPGHIACNSESRSEIVLPALKNGEVVLVLDIDSEKAAYFDETDQQYLEEVMRLVEKIC